MRRDRIKNIFELLMVNSVVVICYLVISIPINFLIPAPYIRISNFPYDFAIGLPLLRYQFMVDGEIQHGTSFHALFFNLVIPCLLLLIVYCASWLWIMPAKNEKQRNKQRKWRDNVRYQLVLGGFLFFPLTVTVLLGLSLETNLFMYINLLVLYIVNLVIFLYYDKLEKRAKELLEDEFEDESY